LVEAVARFWWPRDMTRVTSSSVSTASVTIPGSWDTRMDEGSGHSSPAPQFFDLWSYKDHPSFVWDQDSSYLQLPVAVPANLEARGHAVIVAVHDGASQQVPHIVIVHLRGQSKKGIS
jgi:hypothetical protein